MVAFIKMKNIRQKTRTVNPMEDYYRGYSLITSDTSNCLLEREKVVQKYVAGEKILDIGCGTGKNALIIKNKKLYGVDLSRKNLKTALKRGYFKVKLVDVSTQKLPFPDKIFDTVVSLETLEHLFDPIHALAEANRVMKFGGRIIISTPNIGWIFCRLALLMGIFCDFHDFQLVPCHLRFFTIKRLSKLLLQTGFKLEKVVGTTDFVSRVPFQKLMNALARLYPSLFASNPLLIAKKVSLPKTRKSIYYQISGPAEGIANLFRFG